MYQPLPTQPPPPIEVSAVSNTLARGRLGVPAICFFMLSAAAPFVVVAGVVSNVYGVSGITSVPVAFAAVAVILAVFATGYVAMAKQITNAGAFYSFIAHGLGRVPGVGAALVALLSYNLLQVALYGLLGPVLSGFIEAKAGWAVPWWVCSLLVWAVVAALGVMRIDLNGRVLAVLLVAEIAIITVYDVVMLAHPADTGLGLTTLNPLGLIAPGAGAVLVAGVLGYVGFEQSALFSEEAKNPRRTVRVATYLTLGLIAVVYTVSAWAMSVAAGPDRIAAVAAEQQDGTIFALVAPHLPAIAVDAGNLLMITSVVAGLISYHHATNRYAYALGREHVLPGFLGATSRRTKSPKWASLAQSTIALVCVLVYAVGGFDPLLHGFYVGGLLGGLGVLLLLVAASAAVAAYMTLNHLEVGLWRALVAPTLAGLALLAVTVATLVNFGPLIGMPGSALAWQLPLVYALVAGVGVMWALWLKARRPRIYTGVGLGAHAHTATAPAYEGATA